MIPLKDERQELSRTGTHDHRLQIRNDLAAMWFVAVITVATCCALQLSDARMMSSDASSSATDSECAHCSDEKSHCLRHSASGIVWDKSSTDLLPQKLSLSDNRVDLFVSRAIGVNSHCHR